MPDGALPEAAQPCDAKAQAILAQARCAFVEKGFHGASMQDLARAAGMSAGNFYRYFPSKAAIVEALIARDLAEIEDNFRAVVGSPDPVGALTATLRERVADKCESDDTLWAEIAATATRQPEVARIHDRIEETVTRRVAEVMAVAGGVPEAEAMERFGTHARMVYLVMHGAMSSNLGRTPDEALHDLIIRTVEQLIADALLQAKDGRRASRGRPAMLRLRSLLPLAVCAAAALGLTAERALSQDAEAHAGAPTEAAAAAAAPELPAISVSTVAERTLRDRVIASGLVSAVEEVQVQPLVEGQPIDALLADVGDVVEQGQVLARLSTSTLELQLSQLRANEASAEAALAQAEASLAQAEANAAEAERQATRNAELAQAGTVPQATADQTRASAEAARAAVNVAEQGIASARAQGELVAAQIANAELQIARTEVKAPVAGLVTDRNAQVGAIASAATGTPMFILIRDGAMELRAEVSEQDLVRLEPGQPAALRSTAESEPLAGEVRLVEPAIDPATRLGTARIRIDDSARVVDGMFLTAEILVREGEMLAVPATAIATDADGSAVMRVEDGVVERRPVVPDIRDGALVGIREGLAPGDLVVTKAAAFVRDGDRINPVPAEAEVVAEAGPAVEPAPQAPQTPAAPAPEASLDTAPDAAPGAEE